MKITDIWKLSKRPTISFELFPARTEKGAVSLERAIQSLANLEPDLLKIG